MKTSKTAVVINAIQGKIISAVGYFLSIFMLLGLIGYITDKSMENRGAGIIFAIIMFAVGILSILKGIQIKRRIKRFKIYVDLISMQYMTSIDNLAANTAKNVDFVKKDLRKMISKKFFAYAMIDNAKNEIVIRGLQKPPQAQLKSVACQLCGANNKIIIGQNNECDYCGSVLNE